MQETSDENQLFEKREGKLLEWLESIHASSEIWEKRDNSTDVLKLEIISLSLTILFF